MVFQAYTTGYLITTAENVLLTGKRNPPIWLTLLTVFAALAALGGGVLILLLLKNGVKVGISNPDFSDLFVGILALLLTALFPATLAIKSFLRLENPVTIPRSSIMTVESDGAVVKLHATIKGGAKPAWFHLNTRCKEEADNIQFNLAVHAHGRLRCYPITFLPRHGQTVIYGKNEIRGPVQL